MPGAPEAKTVVLQAHLDMVCEADAAAATDPATDGVFPVVANGWVQAPGTTLGAERDGVTVSFGELPDQGDYVLLSVTGGCVDVPEDERDAWLTKDEPTPEIN